MRAKRGLVLQRRSLHWMLQQERCPLITAAPNSVPDHERHWHGSHLKFAACDMRSGEVTSLYFDLRAGRLTAQGPEPVEAPLGGSLCEEMGLGKARLT
jgi:hypothetical protein